MKSTKQSMKVIEGGKSLPSPKPDEKAEGPLSSDVTWPHMVGGKAHPQSVPNVLFWLEHRGVTARYDEFSHRALVTIPPSAPEALSDIHLNKIMTEMHVAGCFTSTTTVKHGIENLAYANRFHPVRDYLNGLPKWDRRERLGSVLITYLGAADTPLNRAIGKAWMCAAVRRIQEPGVKFDQVLVLRGDQGVGKSAFFRMLASEAWHNDNINIGATSKEVIENASGAWIVEHAELSDMGNRDIERIKQFASTQVDRARTAYEKTAKTVPRQFVCAATVNKDKFLRDDTGNRRFWIVEVKKLDTKALKQDRDQLWAEAVHLLAAGEPINIPAELWPAAAQVNEAHQVDDPIAEKVASVLQDIEATAKSKRAHTDGIVILAQDLAAAIGIPDVTKQGGKVGQSIAAGAKAAGWQASRNSVAGLLKSGQRHYRTTSPKIGKRPTRFAFNEYTAKLELRRDHETMPLVTDFGGAIGKAERQSGLI